MVYQRAGVVVDVLQVGDLLIETGDLSGDCVELPNCLNNVQVEVGALRLQIACGRVETGSEIACRGQHTLAQRAVGRVGRERLQAVEEFSDRVADTGLTARKVDLKLL